MGTTEDQALEAAERELTAADLVLATAKRRVDEPSPSDDFEVAYKDLRQAEWSCKLARGKRDAALVAKQQADLKAKQEDLQRCVRLASIPNLKSETEDLRAQLKRQFIEMRGVLQKLEAACNTRDAAAERAMALASELGIPAPELWASKLGMSAVAAMMYEACATEAWLPKEPGFFWKPIADPTERAHAVMRCFDPGGIVVTDRTPEEAARELLETGRDPRIAFAERDAEKRRIGTVAFEAREAKRKAEYYRGHPMAFLDKVVTAITGSDQEKAS